MNDPGQTPFAGTSDDLRGAVVHERGDIPVSLAGVARTSWGNRWFAQVQHRGVRHYLGTWNSPEDAHAVYLAAKERLQDNNP